MLPDSQVRLWTFQNLQVAERLIAGSSHRADWDCTPQNFRLAYRWMADELLKIAPGLGDDAPVWCWHSCNGVRGQMPTVGTAAMLLSEYDLEQGMVVIELAVPRSLVLLSSYYAWNRFLDVTLVKKRWPRSPLRKRRLFGEPLMWHGTDDIQAVLPSIEPQWLIRWTRLTIADREWEEPVLEQKSVMQAGLADRRNPT